MCADKEELAKFNQKIHCNSVLIVALLLPPHVQFFLCNSTLPLFVHDHAREFQLFVLQSSDFQKKFFLPQGARDDC